MLVVTIPESLEHTVGRTTRELMTEGNRPLWGVRDSEWREDALNEKSYDSGLSKAWKWASKDYVCCLDMYLKWVEVYHSNSKVKWEFVWRLFLYQHLAQLLITNLHARLTKIRLTKFTEVTYGNSKLKTQWPYNLRPEGSRQCNIHSPLYTKCKGQAPSLHLLVTIAGHYEK